MINHFSFLYYEFFIKVSSCSYCKIEVNIYINFSRYFFQAILIEFCTWP